MNTQVILNAAGTLLTNVVLAIIGLVGAYVMYYINLAASKAKAQTQQIDDDRSRKFLENALDDVVNLATTFVGAMEQTSARALREAVKNGTADREELLTLGKTVFDEVKRSIAPAAQEVITKNLGSFDRYLSSVIEDAVLKVKLNNANFIISEGVVVSETDSNHEVSEVSAAQPE